jgi:ribosome biogenesis protein YTM1
MGSKAFFGVAYSPLCKLIVAASADRHIRLYDSRASSGADIKCTFSSHTAWVSCVAWSPKHEHQFVSGSYDQLLKLWDTRCPRAPLYDMAGHDDKILAADWSLPQYMMSGGADNQLKIFKTSDEAVHGCEM